MKDNCARLFWKRCFKASISALVLFSFFGLFTDSYTQPFRDAFQYPYAQGTMRPAFRPFAPVLRVVMPYPDIPSSRGRAFGPGMEFELLERFISMVDYKPRYIYVNTSAEGLELIQKNRADLMVGFGGAPEPEYDRVVAGPSLAAFNPVIVTLPKDTDLAGLYILSARINRVYYQESFKQEVLTGYENAILLDPATHALLIPLHNELQTMGRLEKKSFYHWFRNGRNEVLGEHLAAFWSNPEVEKLRADLSERYYGFMPASPKTDTLLELAQIINTHIGIYSKDIATAAAEYNVDPLLLSAMIFQESRFDPQACSYTGVRGIMQLTANTANMLNVDRLDPSAAIMGGARYLRDIKDSIDFIQDISEWDKWQLALAGFNQGPTVLRRALRSAGSEGVSQDWAGIRTYYGTLQDKGLAGSAFRPKEAVSYVENIRYYYYILSELAHIARPEHENLAWLIAGLD